MEDTYTIAAGSGELTVHQSTLMPLLDGLNAVTKDNHDTYSHDRISIAPIIDEREAVSCGYCDRPTDRYDDLHIVLFRVSGTERTVACGMCATRLTRSIDDAIEENTGELLGDALLDGL